MSNTPNTAFHQLTQIQKERDSCRDLCWELLSAIRTATDCIEELTSPTLTTYRQLITKAEQLLQESSNG